LAKTQIFKNRNLSFWGFGGFLGVFDGVLGGFDGFLVGFWQFKVRHDF